MWQRWSMKGKTRRRLLIADEIIMNIFAGGISPAESWSTYFFVRFNQFLHFLQRRDKLSSFCFMNTNVFQCSALFFCFVLFFFFLSYLKLWHLFPFWHPVKTDGSYSSLSRGAEFLENQLSGEMMSCDMTVFPLPLHLCPTSTNMDDCNLDKSHNPGRYPSVPPEAAALSAPSSPDKGWLLAVQSNLWHEYTPGDCG